MIHLYTIVTDLLKRTGNQQLRKKNILEKVWGEKERNKKPTLRPSAKKRETRPDTFYF